MTPKEACERLRRALRILDEVRTGMGNAVHCYASQDCHAVAMAQFETHKAIERLEYEPPGEG